MSCGVGHRHGLDLVLLWLQSRLAAVAPIQTLAWEFPYATGTALNNKQTNKQTKEMALPFQPKGTQPALPSMSS